MPNDPYLDSSVRWKIRSGAIDFEEPRYRDVADAILSCGLATEVIRQVGAGKEADVYYCRDGTRPLAVKVYRMYRTSHRGGRPVKADVMGRHACDEFDMLTFAYLGEIPVPRPIRRVENMFSMEFLGGPDGPAPQLLRVRLRRPAEQAVALMRSVEEMARSGVVHTDLSAYNILVWRDRPYFIDLASALRVDRLGESPWVRLTQARAYLERGLRSLGGYFRRYGVDWPMEESIARMVEFLDRFTVMD
jgi:serine/threonine-protein kinase RIO1